METFGGLVKKHRQKELLKNLGIEGEPCKTFVGPNYEQGPTVEVDNQKFLQVLETNGQTEVRRELTNQSDTHQAFSLFLDLGEIWLKTNTAVVDYNPKENITNILHEKGFRRDPDQSKDRWSTFVLPSH